MKPNRKEMARIVKARATKRKPATVGTRIAFSPVLPGTVGGVARLSLARRIDHSKAAAIGRAVKAERLRCVEWAARAEYGSVSIYTAMKAIENGTEPE